MLSNEKKPATKGRLVCVDERSPGRGNVCVRPKHVWSGVAVRIVPRHLSYGEMEIGELGGNLELLWKTLGWHSFSVNDARMLPNAGTRAIGVAWGYHVVDTVVMAGAEAMAAQGEDIQALLASKMEES